MYTHPRTSCAAMFWILWIYQIPKCQNKARKTPFSICPVYHPPERHIPSAWAQYGKTFLATGARFILRCKVTQKKWHLQIKVPFFCIFITFRLITLILAHIRAYMSIYFSPLFYAVGEVRPGFLFNVSEWRWFMLSIYVCFRHSPARSFAEWLFGWVSGGVHLAADLRW